MYTIYHSKDLDGLACQAVAEFLANTIEESYPYDYGWDPRSIIDAIPAGAQVLMMDVTMKPAAMEELCSKCDVTVIDHHETAYAELKGIPKHYVYENGVAACRLVWKYFTGSPEPPILTLLGMYDVWEGYGTDRWEKFVLPVQLYGQLNFSVKAVREAIFTGNVWKEWLRGGHLLVDFEKAQFERIRSAGWRTVTLMGVPLAVFNSTVNPGRFMNYMREKEGLKAICTYYQDRNQDWKYSVRSAAPLRINHICTNYGGGGHPQAGGFRTPELIF